MIAIFAGCQVTDRNNHNAKGITMAVVYTIKIGKNRQVRRLEKCIDELIKIHDDGKGSEGTARLIDAVNHEIVERDCE